MKKWFYLSMGMLVAALALFLSSSTAQAQACRFTLGFEAIHNQIPDIVGACVTNEEYDSRGNSLQKTANGLMEWRKADNFTAFTDGYRSWVNGPCGLEQRLNTERFPWEANAEGLPVVSSRCQAAPTQAQAQAPAPPAPAVPGPPAVTSDENAETTTRDGVTVTVIKRLPAPPAQLTGDASKHVDEATVQLVRLTRQDLGIATGTVVGDGRTILTAFHVVGDLDTGKVYDPLLIGVGPYLNYRLRAKVVATDPAHDLAVLRVQDYPGFGGFTSLPLADSDGLPAGEAAYVYSYPARGEGGLGRSTGSVLAIGADAGSGQRQVFLTEAQASPGSSGGVVVNSRGEVIGIISYGVRLLRGVDRPGLPTVTQLTGFVPINLARPVLAEAGGQ